MKYDKARILQDVRTVIDQNQTESGIGGVATDAVPIKSLFIVVLF